MAVVITDGYAAEAVKVRERYREALPHGAEVARRAPSVTMRGHVADSANGIRNPWFQSATRIRSDRNGLGEVGQTSQPEDLNSLVI